jgi:Flp pilus assembly pilin Flp
LIVKNRKGKEQMKKLKLHFKRFLCSISGATLIEIALYVALVVIVCIAVITALGDKLQGVFHTIVDSI